MLRNLLTVFALVLATGLLRAQDPELGQFIKDLDQGIQLKDDKLVDKAVKMRPGKAVQYFQEIRVSIWARRAGDSQAKVDAMKPAWKRCFDNSTTLEQIERWIEAQDQKSYDSYIKYRNNSIKAWGAYTDADAAKAPRDQFEKARDALMEVARQMETTGNKIEAAECWNYVAICLTKMPDKTIQDRKDTVFALEQYVQYRQAWDYTREQFYINNVNFLKAEKAAIERDEKAGTKRAAEGYKDGAKGIETLVMPKAAEELAELTFEPLAAWDTELDYSQKGGPVPAFWWQVSFGKGADGKEIKEAGLTWFRRLNLFLNRLGASKFAINPGDPKLNQDVDVSNKGKPSSFFLDPDKKVPYAMFFWVGTDKEHIGEAEVNLAPSDANTPVYYRSAASWKTTVAGEQVVFYDDNTNGKPMDGDPMDGKFPMHTLGAATTEAPLLDSMRIGKGPRVPYSEFAFIGGAWRWIHRTSDLKSTELKLGTKPLNPDYVKTGKVKLVWAGPKPTAPVQLVIRGSGDFASAAFEVASGKEVEVPASDYQVLWGRILQGKGARAMMATIYTGEQKPFTVEAGKTYELKMGAPFSIDFDRGGSDTDPDVKIDATRIRLRENSGALLAELQGMTLVPELLAAKDKDGKGAKTIGKFGKLSDPELLNTVSRNKAYADMGLMLACFPIPDGMKDKDTMVLTVKLPAPGFKVALVVKKHPLFGEVKSTFR